MRASAARGREKRRGTVTASFAAAGTRALVVQSAREDAGLVVSAMRKRRGFGPSVRRVKGDGSVVTATREGRGFEAARKAKGKGSGCRAKGDGSSRDGDTEVAVERLLVAVGPAQPLREEAANRVGSELEDPARQ